MKRALLFIALCIVASVFLGACVPTDPPESIAYCKEQYEYAKSLGYPNLPNSFVGACVVYLNSNLTKTSAFDVVCNDKDFRADLGVDSKEACIIYIHTTSP